MEKFITFLSVILVLPLQSFAADVDPKSFVGKYKYVECVVDDVVTKPLEPTEIKFENNILYFAKHYKKAPKHCNESSVCINTVKGNIKGSDFESKFYHTVTYSDVAIADEVITKDKIGPRIGYALLSFGFSLILVQGKRLGTKALSLDTTSSTRIKYHYEERDYKHKDLFTYTDCLLVRQ